MLKRWWNKGEPEVQVVMATLFAVIAILCLVSLGEGKTEKLGTVTVSSEVVKQHTTGRGSCVN